MTVANLGLAVDSRQAAGAVVDLDALAASAIRAEKATDSMSSGAKRSEAATAAMSRTIREAAGANDNATSAVRRHIQAIQALTAAESRGGSNSYAQRAADIEAYGRSLDDMRAKVNPAYAAIRQYREQVEQIRTAHRLGAVSADEMTAAISRERQATLGSLAALRERQQVISASGGASGYTSNIAAQFQDIGVTAAMGMSPLQIALQQGTQLSAVFNDLKSQGQSVGSTLATAFMSIVSPMSLVTLGAVAAGAALIQYLASGGEVSKLDDRLKTHADNVSALRDAYGEALEGANTYAKESSEVLLLAARTSAEAVRASLKTITSDIAQSLEASLATAPFEGAFAGYEEFEGAIKALSASAAAGQPGILAFRQAVEDIADARPSDKFLQELAGKFLELTKKAGDTELALEGSNRAIAETARVASGAIAAVQGYRDALTDLAGIALPTLSPMQTADEAYGRALEGATSPGARAAADAEYLEAVTRIKEREAEKQAEIDKRKGEQNAERLIREGMQQEEALARRVEMHQWAIMSEEDAENLSLQKRLEDLEAYYEQGKMSLEEYNQWKLAAEEDHARQVDEIKQRAIEKEVEAKTMSLRVAGDLFGSLASLANAFGEKGFLAAKAFSIAQAVMNTAEGITKAYATVPPPWNVAAAAAVAIAGAAQIATIASTRPGSSRTPTASGGGGNYGSGGGGGGGSSGGSASNDNKALNNTAYVQITGSGDISVEQVRELAEKLVDLQKDGFKLVMGS